MMEVAHPCENVKRLLESIWSWGRLRMVEAEFEELQGLEAIRMGCEEAAKNVIEESD